jgi:hypothetical protein
MGRQVSQGYFVEFGAANGKLFSNTWLLEKKLNEPESWSPSLKCREPKCFQAQRNRLIWMIGQKINDIDRLNTMWKRYRLMASWMRAKRQP